MSYTLEQYKSRREMLLHHIGELDIFMDENPSDLLIHVFSKDPEPKNRYEAAKWLRGVLIAKLAQVEGLINDFDK